MKNFVLSILLSFFIEGVFGESVSVMEGDSVTLHTGLTEIQEDDVLEWRFGAGRDLLARARKGRDPITYNDVLDGKFRDRLKLDRQTGDLTIANITTEHEGDYDISTTTMPFKKTFSVIVVPAVPVKSVSVMVGDSVTLHTGVPEPQRYDVIQWRFGHLNSPIVEINRKTRKSSTSYTTDERFRDRLQLDYWTGSLTIRNTSTTVSGEYEVDITTSNHTIHKPFTVTVSGEIKSALSVKEGDSVTLYTDLTEIQTDDLMQWMFGDSQIAEIIKAGDRFFTSDGRLKLDHQNGSLTITDTRFTDSGVYELKISSSRRTVHKRITVTVTVTDPGLSAGAKAAIVLGVLLVCAAVAAAAAVFYHRHKISELKQALRTLAVMEGESVTLIPYSTLMQDEDIRWMFGGTLIAERKGADQKITVYHDVLDKKFKGRLELEKYIGCLTINDIKTTDSGRYELWSGISGNKSLKTFRVSVFAKKDITKMSVKEGDSVTLPSGVTDIKKVDEILWKFGLNEFPIAQITGGTKKIFPSTAGWRFKGRLKLDHQTRSLTITKINPLDAGFYALYIFKSGETSMKLFRVMLDNPENVPLRSRTYPGV